MRAALLGLLLVLPLAACSLNPKEAPANQQAQQDAADAATCTGYGFKKDTPEFANCLMTLDEQHKGYDAASHQAAPQAAVNQGQAMIQNATPHATTCVPTGAGLAKCY
jgi:hypothetical protein